MVRYNIKIENQSKQCKGNVPLSLVHSYSFPFLQSSSLMVCREARALLETGSVRSLADLGYQISYIASW